MPRHDKVMNCPVSKYKIPYVITFEYTKIIGIDKIQFGKFIIIDDFVFIYANKESKIGDYVHIASFSSISGKEAFILEEFSTLSSGVRIFTSTDDFKEWGFGNSTISDRFRNVYSAPVKIEKFAIIGANSVVLPGVTIGEGAAVGACSVVTKDLEPWGIYIGNKKIGVRNKELILKNYEKFLSLPEEERLGSLLKKLYNNLSA